MRLLNRLSTSVTGGHVLAALAALMFGGFLLFTSGPYPEIQALNDNLPLPEEQLASPEMVHEFLSRIGAEGRSKYRVYQHLDVLNPLLIGSFFGLLILWLLKVATLARQWRVLALLPLVVLLAELWENILLFVAAANHPAPSMGIEMLSAASALKFGGLGASAIVCLVLLGIILIQKFRSWLRQA